MGPNLSVQICFYPMFDGGFYLTASLAMTLIRISIGFLDVRLWWDQRKKSYNDPMDYVACNSEAKPSEFVSIPNPPTVIHAVCRPLPGTSHLTEIAENKDRSLKVFSSEADATAKAAELGEQWGTSALVLQATQRTYPA